MNTNRLSHREHRLQRTAASSWLEELRTVEALNRQLQELEELTPPERLRVLQRGVKLCTHRERRRAQIRSPLALAGRLTSLCFLGPASQLANYVYTPCTVQCSGTGLRGV